MSPSAEGGSNPLAPPNGVPRAGAALPTLPGAVPNFLNLLKALRRCWLRATFVGLAAAAAVATATWFFFPPAKHTARTLLRVPPGSTFLFRTAEQVPALADHQRTQMALVRSRLVLNAALKQKGVGDLSMVRERSEPIEWL